MSREPRVLDRALEQLHGMDAPTAIVPVVCGGRAGVFYSSYVGDPEWMALARGDRSSQALLAISLLQARPRRRARARPRCAYATPRRRMMTGPREAAADATWRCGA